MQIRDAYVEVLKAFDKKINEAITAAIGTGNEAEASACASLVQFSMMRPTACPEFTLLQAKRILGSAAHSYWLLFPAYQNLVRLSRHSGDSHVQCRTRCTTRCGCCAKSSAESSRGN